MNRFFRILLSTTASLAVCSQSFAQVATPCPTVMIPYEQTRKMIQPVLVCGGGSSEYTRTALRFSDEDYNDWFRAIKNHETKDAQEVFLRQPPIQWEGDIPFNSYVEWTWQQEREGADAVHCGTHSVPYEGTCEKTETDYSDPICTKIPEPDTSSSSSGGGSYGRTYGGGGSSDSGSSGRRYSDPAPVVPKSHSEGSYHVTPRRSSRSGSFIIKDYYKLNRVPAGGGCPSGYNFEGYHTKTVQYACTKYRDVPNYCHWDEPHHEHVLCQQQAAHFTAKFAKPGPDWAQGRDPNYHEMLGNKYDLLPGEWEKYTIISNGDVSTQITPVIPQPENAWNKYNISVYPQVMRCEYNGKPSFNVTVNTEGRIKRKSPNAFVLPVDQYGRPKEALQRNAVIGLKGAVGVPGEPYQITLEDASNKMVSLGAKASREFAPKMDPNAPAPVKVKQKGVIATVANHPFWKDTQMRVRLVERTWLGETIYITDDIYTTSALANENGDYVIIPLDDSIGKAMRENGKSAQSLYQATGPFNSLLGAFWRQHRVHLTPGERYEVRVSMYQRGLPFYDSGCKGTNANCEGEKINKKAFGQELVVKFTADKRADERTWLNKLVDWRRAPLWTQVRMLLPF